MAEPSIKGSIFKGASDDLARLKKGGRVSEEQIEARLTAQDQVLLEAEVNQAAWYPLESYTRIVQFLGEVEGEGKDSYYVERGRASARRLMEAGLYQQLAFLRRWGARTDGLARDEVALIADFRSKLKLVISLTSNIYNVGRWTVESDPDNPGRLRIVVREARAYSEPMRLAIEGFFNECSRHSREELAHLYTSERPAPDLILLRMTHDIAEIAATRERSAGAHSG